MGAVIFAVPNVVVNYPLTTPGRLQTFTQACEIAVTNRIQPGDRVALPLSQETIRLLPHLGESQYLRAGFFIAFGHWLQERKAKVMPLISKEVNEESVGYVQLAMLIEPDGKLPDLGEAVMNIRKKIRDDVESQQRIPFFNKVMSSDQAWRFFAKEQSLEELETAHRLSRRKGFSVEALPNWWAQFRRETVAPQVAAFRKRYAPRMIFVEEEIARCLGYSSIRFPSEPLGDPFPALRWLYRREGT